MRRCALATVAVGAVIGLTACTGVPASNSSSTPTGSASRLGPAGADGCAPASPIVESSGGFPEVQATSADGVGAYGLMMPTGGVPLEASSDTVKIVWRVTGTGPLDVATVGPDGRTTALVWGPEEHGGSTYGRPGREWGTGLLLDAPGCWEVRLSRTDGTARVWFDVGGPD